MDHKIFLHHEVVEDSYFNRNLFKKKCNEMRKQKNGDSNGSSRVLPTTTNESFHEFCSHFI